MWSRAELSGRLNSESQLRSDATARLREQEERSRSDKAAVGALNQQITALEAARGAEQVAHRELQDKVLGLRSALEKERQQRTAWQMVRAVSRVV